MPITISHPQAFSQIGTKPNQEDSLFPLIGKATDKTRIFLVCDGMGGHEHGEVASRCVADTIGKMTSAVPPCSTSQMRQHFEEALAKAYDNLDALDSGTDERVMGTTLTFLAICTDGFLVAHIGDSRVYQLRKGCGVVFRTRDHSLVSDLIASGDLTEEEARTFPQKNVITRAVQPHQEYPCKASYKVLTDIQYGDVFFLCCDGVIEQLTDQDLSRFLLSKGSLSSRMQSVSKECTKRHTRDNNSAYAIEIAPPESGFFSWISKKFTF